ncbi:hypothetical protein BP6252_06572 [Coleophoma cylindrospora]|uniref:Glycoside hydrolase family 35 protein n=1 Tax=Coleophoma cylindrospora TaxID=1849047 RepID=A0A3D8RNA4_9HELO|nr:hypothetical protein BP6252_06572 [Coleophoma cylindrospora]
MAPSIPHLRKTPTSSQLIVNGKPFLMLAGELHNSSLSSAEYMRTVWPNMKAMNINTLLGSVTWEMIEPEEGRFDFAELDEILHDARTHDMHLVLLWFGSFKNALSTYTPAWVRKDVKRFPRVHVSEAGAVIRTEELVSPFNPQAWEADAKAFGKLMQHLKEVDSEHSTVLMIQVENETGLLGDSRDRSRMANELFKKPVPQPLLQHLQQASSNSLHPKFVQRFPGIHSLTAGEATWEDCFGKGPAAEEMFMADAFSKYISHVAASGKKEYPIPLYTNVWLNVEDDNSNLDVDLPVIVGGGGKPGVYPSGGACPHTLDVWKFNTGPHLDFIAPDLYFHDYESVCIDYRHGNQPLFIPEQRRDEKGARRVWLAYGTYASLGCSPFGIDSELASEAAITRHYGLLSSVSSFVLERQAINPDDVMGFFFDELDEDPKPRLWVRQFGKFEITIDRAFVFGKPGPGAGLIIHLGDGKFLLVGWGFNFLVKSVNPKATFSSILHAEEKVVSRNQEGAVELKTGRVLNGDEHRHGEFLMMANEDPDYGGFPIAVTPGCRTMICELEVYDIEEEEEDF